MGYTTRSGENLLGVGTSSISEVDGWFAQNAPELGPWQREIDAGAATDHAWTCAERRRPAARGRHVAPHVQRRAALRPFPRRRRPLVDTVRTVRRRRTRPLRVRPHLGNPAGAVLPPQPRFPPRCLSWSGRRPSPVLPGCLDIGAPMRAPAARIGPNTIIQLAHVLRDRHGRGVASSVLFESTGYALTAPPRSHGRRARGAGARTRSCTRSANGRVPRVLHEAGRRTADYLMANRIPAPCAVGHEGAAEARRPGGAAARPCRPTPGPSRGAAPSAWSCTRTGDDAHLPRLRHVPGHEAEGPVCDFYAGTFEHLIRTLVAPRAEVREVECQAQGGHCCRFEVTGIH
jgi:divinyl protochlorophyllide a 8-vinyl-reductase